MNFEPATGMRGAGVTVTRARAHETRPQADQNQ